MSVTAQLNQFADLTSSRSFRKKQKKYIMIFNNGIFDLISHSCHLYMLFCRIGTSICSFDYIMMLSFDNVSISLVLICALIGFDAAQLIMYAHFFTYRLREHLSVCLRGTT